MNRPVLLAHVRYDSQVPDLVQHMLPTMRSTALGSLRLVPVLDLFPPLDIGSVRYKLSL